MEAQRNPSSEEIDLLYVFNTLVRGAKVVRGLLAVYLRRLWRNAVLFVGILVLSGLAGYSLRYLLPQRYRTTALFLTHQLPPQLCTGILESLGWPLDPKSNAPFVAAQMNLPVDVVTDITSASAEPIASLQGTLADTAARLPAESFDLLFRVNLVVGHPARLPQIQAGIQRLLENNEYARRLKTARRQKLGFLKSGLEGWSRSLDSLKPIAYRSPGPALQGNGPSSLVQVYQLQRAFLRQQLEVQEQLSLRDDIEVVVPFMATKAEAYYAYNTFLFYALVAGLLAALVLTPLIGRR
ncbi:hypothetical protein V9K67_10830 [Paraflavisolibacter sp. H34]|uniref:hypothetical protein n=1 Tax=Huijunlia imazamoxiresistens TaxID=3127457 RepID=UPI0030186A31